jgi:hypothetical protein
MNLRWRFETQAPYARLLAVVREDGDGFSATIEGKIVASPQARDARVRDRKITDQHYGPESVCAHSLEALRRAVDEKIENDIGPVNKWTADPG